VIKTILNDSSGSTALQTPAQANPFNLPIDLNPTDYLNGLIGLPGKVISNATSTVSTITTDISNVASNNLNNLCLFSDCSKQTTTTTNTNVTTINGNNNNTTANPTSNVTPTNSPSTLSPNFDLSGLLTLLGSTQNKSNGSSQTATTPLSDLTSMLPLIAVAGIAVLGIFLVTKK